MGKQKVVDQGRGITKQWPTFHHKANLVVCCTSHFRLALCKKENLVLYACHVYLGDVASFEQMNGFVRTRLSILVFAIQEKCQKGLDSKLWAISPIL